MEKLIHLTDPHLVVPPGRLFGLDPVERLAPAIDVINRDHGDAKGVFVTGDLAHRGEEGAYRALKDLLDRLTVPYYLLLGNHDARPEFDRVFPDVPRDEAGFVQYEVALENGVCLLLDSLDDGNKTGRLCEERLAWLKARLATHHQTDVFLFLHHPPFDIGIKGIDEIRLTEGADMLRHILLRGHERVRHLFFGHVHRPMAGSWAGIPISTLFATNHQIALDLSESEEVFGTIMPAALGVVLIDADSVFVHMQSYAGEERPFVLRSTKNEVARSPEQLYRA